MLTPDYLDTLPDAVAALWQQVEDDILQDIARRIGALDEIEPLTPTAAWQAWRYEQMQACHQDALSTIARYSGRSRDAIRKTMRDAGLEALADDSALAADGDTYDATRIVVRALDTYGNLCPFYSGAVTVSTNGVVKVLGPSSFGLIGGCIAFWVKTCGRAGLAHITVTCGQAQANVALTVSDKQTKACKQSIQ